MPGAGAISYAACGRLPSCHPVPLAFSHGSSHPAVQDRERSTANSPSLAQYTYPFQNIPDSKLRLLDLGGGWKEGMEEALQVLSLLGGGGRHSGFLLGGGGWMGITQNAQSLSCPILRAALLNFS